MNIQKLMDAYFGLYDRMRRWLIKKSDRRYCKERITGKVKLTREQKKSIKAFYAPYGRVTSIFHQMFYEKNGIFSEKYLPTDIYTNKVDEYFNPRQEAKYLDNKCYYTTLFAGIKQAQTVVCRMGGFWYDGNMKMIDTDALCALVRAERVVFAKVATESYGGKGVLCLDSEDGDIYEQLCAFVKKVRGDIIVQRPIEQHPALSSVNESSVNTVRILSLLTEDGPKIYSRILRVGGKGQRVDNFSSGGIAVGIDEAGVLKKYGYNSMGERFTATYSGDFTFEGFAVPFFDKIIDVVKRAHPMVPHFRLVSFDLAVDKEGEVVLVEANLCKGGINVHQLNNGPLFGEDTERILNEVYGVTKGK